MQAVGLCVEARLAASAGRFDEAVGFARQGVELVEPTDALNLRAETLATLGETFELAGLYEQAQAWRELAVNCYAAKGNFVAAAQARTPVTSSAASS